MVICILIKEYINKILSLVENQQHNLLNLESDNLLDILTRHHDRVVDVAGSGAFFEKVKKYFTENTENYKLTHSLK